MLPRRLFLTFVLVLLPTLVIAEPMKPTEAERVQALIIVLQENDPVLRAAAAEALGNIGPAAEKAIRPLTEALEDPNARVCNAAARGLLRINPKTEPILTGALKHKQPRVRIAVLKALHEAESDAVREAIPQLVDCLQHRNEAVRIHAALALGKSGREAAAPLRALLKAQDDDVRGYALWALGSIGPEARECVPEIIAILRRENGWGFPTQKAAYALCRIAPDSPEVVRALAEYCDSMVPLPGIPPAYADSTNECLSTIEGSLAQQGIRRIPFYVENLRAANTRLRLHITGMVGHAACSEVNSAFQMIGIDHAFTRRDYALGLFRDCSQAEVAALAAKLDSHDAGIREAIIAALYQLQFSQNVDLTDAIPILLRLLAHQDPGIRASAAVPLAWIGVDSKEAIAALKRASNDPDEGVRRAAAEALEQIGYVKSALDR